MNNVSSNLILCTTARLARSLNLAHARAQRVAGVKQWQPLQAMTLAQWLEGGCQQAMLTGKLAPQDIPRLSLSGMAERLLWEQVISNATSANPQQQLFDMTGMAQLAMEANVLMQAWGVRFSDDLHTEETRQFLRWRAAFRALCKQHDALEETRLRELQIRAIAHVSLPPVIHLAGFASINPQEQRLFDALIQHGVQLNTWVLGLPLPAQAVQMAFDEADAECRAAVAWVRERLAANPAARLAIVVPELAALRSKLQAMLDDALHPESIHPAHADMPRCYDFSLGQPLAEVPLVTTALALLRLACSYRTTQQETGQLLRDVYWSASVSEADARARLEAQMRRKLPATISLEQLLRFAKKLHQEGLGLSRFTSHLEALQQKTVTGKQLAAGWINTFSQMLEAAHWPGERSLTSVEFQSKRAWLETLQTFAELSPLLGKMAGNEALRQLARMLRDRIFQPESTTEPQVQVMGMLEAISAPLDALWVMGMNDHVWPPPARVNPLLPAESQRRIGAPNSCASVQADFARNIHRRLLHAAPQVVFSWAQREGERELRVSPVLKEIPLAAASVALLQTMAEQLAQPAQMQWQPDHQAPPVTEGEKVRGGTGLFQAQAICPAWGYYRYRLGAKALDAPVDGLDNMARGSLLHAVLQAFWNDRSSDDLQAMDAAAQQQAVQAAVEAGVEQFMQLLDEALPQHFLALEKLRLAVLLNGWLALERERPPFAVQHCEHRVKQDINGITVEFTLDRVDSLSDGQLVVLDYKTGSNISTKSWAEYRITEPQLPIYAALVLVEGEISAVCFAKVKAGEHQFIGIAHDSATLPGVKGLDDARKQFDEEKFPFWHDLLQHWRDSLEAIADEIKAGEAAVCFEDEDDLAYCEVKPLLRLPERKLQMERGGKG